MSIGKRIIALLSSALCFASGTAYISPHGITAYAAYETAVAVRGDVNADGIFDVSDAVALKKWLLAVPDAQLVSWQAGDLCEDGRLDIFDLCEMRRLLVEGEPSDPSGSGDLLNATVAAFNDSMPTTGSVRILSIYVDFADAKYRSDACSTEQLRNELYGSGSSAFPYESVTAWYDRASYGNLHIEGDVYRYTCSGNLSDYMPDTRSRGFEMVIMEALRGLDGQINYADYDSDNDGRIDCISYTVPLDYADSTTKSYWYGCTSKWYYNPGFTVDNVSVGDYITMDVMPYQSEMVYLKKTLMHEMGHCMGLPDYYKYDSSDWEGMHGAAGYERMDDSVSDLNSFSKLMCGWLRDTEVQAYKGSGTQTFSLSDASVTGSCLILPISSDETNITSEYFLVEYVTRSGNNSDIPYGNSGIRILHVQAELYTDQWHRTNFKYGNYSPSYMGDDKIRVLRLVNDNGGFYNTGDTVTYGVSGFAAYDSDGAQTVNTGYTVTIGGVSDGKYIITVSR